jgi:hypothetical protein
MPELDWEYYSKTGKAKTKSRKKKSKEALKSLGRITYKGAKGAYKAKKKYEKKHGSLWNIAGTGWIWSKPKKRKKKRKKRK